MTQNSAENPFPVRAVAIRVAGWIDKLGAVWVEGQLAQITMRPDAKTVFMVLRDPAADMSLTVTCSRDLVLSAPVKLAEGVQVVVCGKPSFYTGRGTFSLRLSEIRAVAIVSPGLLAPGLLVTITGALEAPGRRGPVAARHPHGSGGMLAGADAGHVRSQCLRIPNGRSHRLCWRSAIEVVSLAAAVTVAVGSS